MLLTICPRAAVRAKSASSNKYGRPGPIASMTRSAIRSAAPLDWIAADNGIRAPISTTICQEMAGESGGRQPGRVGAQFVRRLLAQGNRHGERAYRSATLHPINRSRPSSCSD